MMGCRPHLMRHTWITCWTGSIVLGLGLFVASFAVTGCGGGGAEGEPLTPEQAKKTAKYRELHPEEFPAVKSKTSRKRRGG